MKNATLKRLHNKKRSKLIKLIENNGFKVKDNGFSIDFEKDLRIFTIHSLDSSDPYWITTDISLEKYLKKNFFQKTKHTKSFKDKLYNEKMNVEQALKTLNWEHINTYSIKDFDCNPTIEEPFAEVIHQIKIRELPHIIIDDLVYEGEATPLLALVKPLALDALASLSSPDFIKELKGI